MKSKVLLLAAVLTLTCAANSFAAFAWLTTTGGAATVTTTNSVVTFAFKPSAKVVFGYDVATTGITYSLGTFHETGTRSFGTTSTDTNIYCFDNAAASLNKYCCRSYKTW
ncbi:MAG: hypothetical protein IPQ16_14465 [Geobacteraceae bacterium]|nr:hypothetical protein [Geobacteraceae bacterium]